MSSAQSFRSFTMKQAPLSSTVHGGGKRRGAMLISVSSAGSQGLPNVPFRETWAR